jgi:transcription elongation factor Elf1
MASVSHVKTFTCPNCNALYQVVKVEAGPETNDRAITCRVCGGPLAGREGKSVLKYFLLRKAIRRKHGGAKAT